MNFGCKAMEPMFTASAPTLKAAFSVSGTVPVGAGMFPPAVRDKQPVEQAQVSPVQTISTQGATIASYG